MLKKRAINRILITTIMFFLVFILYSLLEIENKVQESKEEKFPASSSIYTLNKDSYISKTNVYVSKFLTLEDKIKEKIEIMIEENNKNALLPSYFKPILPKNTKIEKVKLEENIAKLYFSKEFNNVTKEQSEKMIEAIVYTILDEEILGLEIYVENEMLKYAPNTKKELPTLLTKDFGINKVYEISSTDDIVKIVMSYYSENNETYYEIPITKYVNDKREKIEIILEELKQVHPKNFITYIENVNILSYKVEDEIIKLKIDKELSNEEKKVLSKAVFNNYEVEKIELTIKNDYKKEEISKKN